MTEFRFTTEQALEALRKAVELKGSDYVYPPGEKDSPHGSCMYAHNGSPSCIVGHLVNILDPEIFARLAAAEEQGGPHGAEELTNPDVNYLPEDFWSPSTARVLGFAQYAQDRGELWGTALATAEDNV